MRITHTAAAAVIGLVLAGAAGCGSAPARSESSSSAPASQALACRPPPTRKEIEDLFDRWNRSLQTGDPRAVVANYAERSILLPTLSNVPRVTPAEKEEYFKHFLENKPSGVVTYRFFESGCNSAFDAGLYTFTFARTGQKVPARYTFTYAWDGKQWLITSHHSSAMPEPVR
ncbi:MAG TPA: DUF4440 domain-containing protein [Rudaea sp.]|nr:DUF4440 domain-containing protein [Rudaea sp.]